MIREATVWDAYAICDLWVSMVEEVAVPNRYADIHEKERYFLNLILKIKGKDSAVYVAEIDNQVVGYISGYLHFLDYGVPVMLGTCDSVYVRPEYRSTGIAANLIDRLTDFVTNSGAKELQFQTKYDLGLAKVWERRGFKPVQITYMKEV